MRMATWILNCYPRRWRERYQEEMLALLEQHTVTLKTVLDLFLGALDARLNSVYRSKGGFMLQRIHDNRSLSLIYLCSLAVFQISHDFWNVFSTIFFSHFARMDVDVSALLGNISHLIGILILIPVLGIAGITIGQACKNRQRGTIIFAFICLGVTAWALWKFPSLLLLGQYNTITDLSSLSKLVSLLPLLLDEVTRSFLFGGGLFLSGMNGLKLFHERQRGPLLFALLIFFLPAISISLFGFLFPNNQSTPLASLATWVLVFSCYFTAPYLSLSGLLLTLAHSHWTQRAWQRVRIWGAIWSIPLLLTFLIIVVWDVYHIIGNGTWTFASLIMNALILALALAFMLLALARSSLISTEKPLPEPANA